MKIILNCIRSMNIHTNNLKVLFTPFTSIMNKRTKAVTKNCMTRKFESALKASRNNLNYLSFK